MAVLVGVEEICSCDFVDCCLEDILVASGDVVKELVLCAVSSIEAAAAISREEDTMMSYTRSGDYSGQRIMQPCINFEGRGMVSFYSHHGVSTDALLHCLSHQ